MNTALAKLFLRKEKLTEKDWIIFLEEMRQIMKPQLDKFTLPTFGDLACMDDGKGRYNQIRKNGPSPIRSDYTLDDHGLSYFTDDNQRLHQDSKEARLIKAYGLSRSGEWVNIVVHVKARPTVEDRAAYGPERAFAVGITKTTLEHMLQESGAPLHHVWMIMRLAVDNWKAKRTVLLQEAEKLAREFEVMDDLVTTTAFLK